MQTQLIKGPLLLLVLAFVCQTCNGSTSAVHVNARNTVQHKNRRSPYRKRSQAMIKPNAHDQGERKIQEKSSKTPKAPKSSKDPKSTKSSKATKSSKSPKSAKSVDMSLVGSSSMKSTSSSAMCRHGLTASFVSLAAASFAIYSL